MTRRGPDGFGESLRQRRRAAGLTQREFAKRAGVSERALRSWENEHAPVPRTASMLQVERTLDSLAADSVDQRATIDILGPLRVHIGTDTVAVSQRHVAAFLALLALHANTPVSRDAIIDVLWGDQPPPSAVSLVQSYTGTVRRLLRPAGQLVRMSRDSYQLTLDDDQLDAARFTALTERAAAAAAVGDLLGAHDLYAASLDCWAGPLLADLDDRLSLHPAAVTLTARRRAASRDYAMLALELGRPAAVVMRLQPQVAEDPLHEGLYAPLILALAGTGQQAAALALYDRLRTQLDTELGVQPMPEVREAHLRVLRGTAATIPDFSWNCLPRDVHDFTGRDAEIRSITGVAALNITSGVTVIEGMAGVGKTALAIHAAHRLTADYPDGQLFVDLRAHSEGHDPLAPRDALEGLLRQLGIEGDRIPEHLDDCAALWRAQTAGRRLLIVLDNALGAAQVRPLLPASTRGRTLVTSRTRLCGIEGARQISLDVLSPAEAARLFGTALDRPMTGDDVHTAAEIARLCGFLPVALRIAAARVRSRPAWSLAHLAARLADEHHRLRELRAGDSSVEATIALSYRHLGVDQQRLFRLLGRAPGPDIDLLAAAALADLPVADTERLLDGLLDGHLLFEHRPGHYRFHDLVRHYARAIPQDTPDHAPLRDSATKRHRPKFSPISTAPERKSVPANR